MIQVIVYSTDNCPSCVKLKEFLSLKGISFQEINVTELPLVREELSKRSGQRGSPMVEINGELIVGFNPVKLSKMLNL